MSRAVAFLAVALLLAGCSRAPVVPPEPEEKSPVSQPPPGARLADRTDQLALARDEAHFALELHRRLRRDGNLVTSPVAAGALLALACAAARDETAGQIKRALHSSLPDNRLHPAVAALGWQLTGRVPRGCTLHLGNALWTDRRVPLQPGFLAAVRDHYPGGSQSADFRQREQACRTINDWAARQTSNRINEVVRPHELDEEDAVVLTSVVSFQGAWQTRFSPSLTRDGQFHVAPGQTVTVPMMHQEARFRCYPPAGAPAGSEAFQLLILPLEEGTLEFVLLLPRRMGLAELESVLSPALLDEWMAKARSSIVDLTLPRLQLRNRLVLLDPLRALGVRRPFGAEANFFPLTRERTLHIGRVNQCVSVAVNEEGAEEAAALDVAADGSKAAGQPWLDVRVDRPFLFLIRHADTGAILFLGRVSNPAG